MKPTFATFGACLLLSGCIANAPKPLYDWGDYSESLYRLKKSPNAESVAEHNATLKKLIAEAAQSGGRVPPGVHAELGFMQIRDGKIADGMANLKLEKALYPESSVFIDRLLAMIERKAGPGSDKISAKDGGASALASTTDESNVSSSASVSTMPVDKTTGSN